MYINKDFVKKTFNYYFIGILSLILANLFFSICFFFTKIILLSLIFQYICICIFKYFLYSRFKLFSDLNFKRYLIVIIVLFILNNLYLNFFTFKNIYFLQFTYTILTSFIGFLLMTKIMNK